MIERKHHLFVYGTLKKGFGNNRLLEKSNALYLGQACTDPKFTLITLGYIPGVLGSGETQIWGEVYKIDDPTLARTDRLEGHPNFYKREQITVNLLSEKGYKIPDTWMYIYQLRKRERDPGYINTHTITGGFWPPQSDHNHLKPQDKDVPKAPSKKAATG